MDSREDIIRRLNNALGFLGHCCTDDFDWPPESILDSVNDCVRSLMDLHGIKRSPLTWSTFIRLDERRRSLRLVSRIDRLIKRGIERRKDRCAQSALEKAISRSSRLELDILLRKFVLNPESFVAALDEHDDRLMHRFLSWGLLHWACAIEHPNAPELILPDVEPVRLAGLTTRVRQQINAQTKRLQNRERQKRHRKRKIVAQNA
jgi:hypothetical protein